MDRGSLGRQILCNSGGMIRIDSLRSPTLYKWELDNQIHHQRIFEEDQMMLQYFNQVLKNCCSSVINLIVPLRMIPTVSMQKEQTNSAASVRI